VNQHSVLKTALISVPAIVIVGMLMGYLSNSGFSNDWYAALKKPAFQPPAWMFGVVWTILYAMLGLALALVLNSPASKERRDALWLFGGQLALNYAWSPVFFGWRMIDGAGGHRRHAPDVLGGGPLLSPAQQIGGIADVALSSVVVPGDGAQL
jgi:translocator protein